MGIETVEAWSSRLIRQTLDRLGVRPSKARGQNFLTDPAVARRIAGAAEGRWATAVEIGPGLGALTEALLERGGQVVAVEIDPRLCGHLRERFSGREGLTVLEADARRLDWRVFDKYISPRIVFSNLPYSQGAPILEKIFQHSGLFSEAVLCFQREVADRVVSAGGRGMGSLTLLAHRFCLRREKLFNLPPSQFYPKPDVASTVLRLGLRSGVVWDPVDAVWPRKLFAQRRKKLSSAVPPEVLGGLTDSRGRPLASCRIDELGVEEAAVLGERLRLQIQKA